MLLEQQIAESLTQLKGHSSVSPRIMNWHAGQGIELCADFTAVDTLGCACRELRATTTELRDGSFELAKGWSQALSKRVTYLLEQIGPLELDGTAQSVLVRSIPPTKQAGRTSYYEIVIQSPGQLALRRYERDGSTEGRRQIDLHMTHEVLQRLARDVTETLPL